jgi:hypothetical protein
MISIILSSCIAAFFLFSQITSTPLTQGDISPAFDKDFIEHCLFDKEKFQNMSDDEKSTLMIQLMENIEGCANCLEEENCSEGELECSRLETIYEGNEEED